MGILQLRRQKTEIRKNKQYPIYFISKYGCRMYQTNSLSVDGTPRYLINPNSDATYSLHCMLDDGYKPIYKHD